MSDTKENFNFTLEKYEIGQLTLIDNEWIMRQHGDGIFAKDGKVHINL